MYITDCTTCIIMYFKKVMNDCTKYIYFLSG